MSAHTPKLERAEEAALLEKIQSGTQIDKDMAYQRIFAALREPVYALCLQLTGNTVDAEDAVQESFIAAFRGLSMFRGEARISTWLYRIAVREALRHKKRHGANDPRIVDEPASPETTNPAINRERMEQLNTALDRLSAEHRTVLVMFAIQELSHSEIATALKIPTGTVWSRLHKARKVLANEMAALENQPRSGSAIASGNRQGAKRRPSATTSILGTFLRRAGALWPWLAGWRAVAFSAPALSIDVIQCRRCSGRLRVTAVVTEPDEIALALHGARGPPPSPPPGQLCLVM